MGDVLDCGRRAAALLWWRWVSGMLTDTGIRVVAVGRHDGQPFIVGHLPGNAALDRYYTDPPLFAPDLSDAATRGAVLGLLREAYRDPSLTTRCLAPLRIPGDSSSGFAPGPWDVMTSSRSVTISLHGSLADTEAAALVAALEAAPIAPHLSRVVTPFTGATVPGYDSEAGTPAGGE